MSGIPPGPNPNPIPNPDPSPDPNPTPGPNPNPDPGAPPFPGTGQGPGPDLGPGFTPGGGGSEPGAGGTGGGGSWGGPLEWQETGFETGQLQFNAADRVPGESTGTFWGKLDGNSGEIYARPSNAENTLIVLHYDFSQPGAEQAYRDATKAIEAGGTPDATQATSVDGDPSQLPSAGGGATEPEDEKKPRRRWRIGGKKQKKDDFHIPMPDGPMGPDGWPGETGPVSFPVVLQFSETGVEAKSVTPEEVNLIFAKEFR